MVPIRLLSDWIPTRFISLVSVPCTTVKLCWSWDIHCTFKVLSPISQEINLKVFDLGNMEDPYSTLSEASLPYNYLFFYRPIVHCGYILDNDAHIFFYLLLFLILILLLFIIFLIVFLCLYINQTIKFYPVSSCLLTEYQSAILQREDTV